MKRFLRPKSAVRGILSNSPPSSSPRLEAQVGQHITKHTKTELFSTHLDDIDPPDTGLFANLVERNKELKGVRILLVTYAELDWQTLLEENSNVDRLIWRGPRINGSSPHIIWGRDGGIFQSTRLIAAVSYVVIHAVWLGFGGCHWNPRGSGIVKQVVATLKPIAELRNSPRSNDLDLRVDGKERQF